MESYNSKEPCIKCGENDFYVKYMESHECLGDVKEDGKSYLELFFATNSPWFYKNEYDNWCTASEIIRVHCRHCQFRTYKDLHKPVVLEGEKDES